MQRKKINDVRTAEGKQNRTGINNVNVSNTRFKQPFRYDEDLKKKVMLK
jgi:hypothetical protein